jgi:hypothetical protein
MKSGKEVKKNINVLETMHYIMAAWQQASQQTIQNCFRKARHKYQLDGNEMANDNDDDNDDDFGQDWEELCRAQKYDFQSYVSVDHQMATSGIKLLKNYVKHVGLQGVWRKKMKKTKMNKRWCLVLPRLTKVYKKLRLFLCAKWKRHGP